MRRRVKVTFSLLRISRNRRFASGSLRERRSIKGGARHSERRGFRAKKYASFNPCRARGIIEADAQVHQHPLVARDQARLGGGDDVLARQRLPVAAESGSLG